MAISNRPSDKNDESSRGNVCHSYHFFMCFQNHVVLNVQEANTNAYAGRATAPVGTTTITSKPDA